ncbi:MAG: glycosyltransferase family 2 protein [Thermoproteota archaeon]
MKTPVSVVILTLNEEQNIERCLRSVYDWTDDIHIIDSFSDDNTVKIAQRYTQNIYQVQEAHWARIRNWVLKNLQMKYEWVLFLDADEMVTEELKHEISELLNGDVRENGFYIKRRFVFLGRWLKHGGLYVEVLRLFRRKFAEYVEFGDSEYVIVKGKVSHLKADMIHEDKKGISRWIEKHVRIADREAKRIIEGSSIKLKTLNENSEIEGKERVYLRVKIWDKIPLSLKPFVLFFYTYFIKLGFLDGIEGLVYHLLWSLWYRLLIYARVRELEKKSI